MALVTARTLIDAGASRRTAHRWVTDAVRRGAWPTETIPGRTKPTLALVVDDEAYAALLAGLR